MQTPMVSPSTDSLRQKVVEAAKAHKASWIQLGQYLFTVHRDKLFKDWGFLTFEAYCIKELGIKQVVASKLLKSYAFLEKEEPRLAALSRQVPSDDGEDGGEEDTPKNIPNYESVNLLRLAKENKAISAQEFAEIRESVLEGAKDPKEVKAQVKRIIEEKKEDETPAEKMAQKSTKIKRLVSLLKTTAKDLGAEDVLPDYLVKQIDALISKLEDQLRD